VCYPAGLAARLLRTPLVLVNADAALLLSNKALLPVAARIAFGFDGAAAQRTRRAVVTGNPVRAEIAQIKTPAQRFATRSGPLQLLVIGGSLGARVLNESVPNALAMIRSDLRPKVVHQCGAQHVDAVRSLYSAVGVEAEIVAFIDDMPARYAAADLVVCRAGAITVSELAAAGVASVLVPLVVATTSHQRANAQFMAANDAAIHLPQSELNAPRLAELLTTLTRDRLLAMAHAAHSLGRPDATDRVAAVIEKVAA